MNIPDKEIEHLLFATPIDIHQLKDFEGPTDYVNLGGFSEIHWLNTPGPIYTTITDNCGTGQEAALSNVGGDEEYLEVIFKQPVNRRELTETLAAAAMDLFGSYCFDGNSHWNISRIRKWWGKSEERINYILTRYKEELHMTPDMISPVYGPRRPVPDNYKFWLDFYQFGMKEYLEWYITKVSGKPVSLPLLNFDWTKRVEYDQLFDAKGF